MLYFFSKVGHYTGFTKQSPFFIFKSNNSRAYSGCIINAIDLLREMNQENKRKLPGDARLLIYAV